MVHSAAQHLQMKFSIGTLPNNPPSPTQQYNLNPNPSKDPILYSTTLSSSILEGDLQQLHHTLNPNSLNRNHNKLLQINHMGLILHNPLNLPNHCSPMDHNQYTEHSQSNQHMDLKVLSHNNHTRILSSTRLQLHNQSPLLNPLPLRPPMISTNSTC